MLDGVAGRHEVDKRADDGEGAADRALIAERRVSLLACRPCLLEPAGCLRQGDLVCRDDRDAHRQSFQQQCPRLGGGRNVDQHIPCGVRKSEAVEHGVQDVEGHAGSAGRPFVEGRSPVSCPLGQVIPQRDAAAAHHSGVLQVDAGLEFDARTVLDGQVDQRCPDLAVSQLDDVRRQCCLHWSFSSMMRAIVSGSEDTWRGSLAQASSDAAPATPSAAVCPVASAMVVSGSLSRLPVMISRALSPGRTTCSRVSLRRPASVAADAGSHPMACRSRSCFACRISASVTVVTTPFVKRMARTALS